MTWRKIITYYFLFVFLVGYYLLFETRPRKTVEIRRAALTSSLAGQKRPFLNLAQEAVQEVVIRRPEGEVVCRRDAEGWKVIKPASAQVAPGLVSGLVADLVQSKEAELMAEAPADLSPFGLDLPRSTLVLKTDAQSLPVTVFLGERNPASTAVYARLEGSPHIFLLGLTVKYYEELLFQAAGVGKEKGLAARD